MNASHEFASAVGRGMTFAGAALFLVTVFIVAGPIAETKWLPVLEDIEFRPVLQDPDGALMLRVLGRKARQCEYLDVSVLVERENGEATLGNVVFAPRVGSKNRPIGDQDFGVWTVVPYGKAVQFDVHHDCHPLWTTTTRLTWTRPKKEPS